MMIIIALAPCSQIATSGLVFNTITRSVVEGDKVLISGFGTFKVNDRKARKGISPKTQEEMIIPASKTVTFKPSNRLKDAMN